MILLQILYPISLSYVCVYEPLSLFVYISVFCLFVPFSVARFVPTPPPGPPHPTGSGGVVFFFLSCLVVCIYVSPPLWQVLFVSLYCVLVFVVMCPHLSGMSCVFLFHMFLCVASFVSFFFMCFLCPPLSGKSCVFLFIVSYSAHLPQGRLYWLDRLYEQYFSQNRNFSFIICSVGSLSWYGRPNKWISRK